MSDTFLAGRLTLTGSAQQLSMIPSSSAVTIKALGAAGCYIGGSDVTTSNGFPLEQGKSITVTVVNPRKIYVLGTNTQEIAWASVGG